MPGRETKKVLLAFVLVLSCMALIVCFYSLFWSSTVLSSSDCNLYVSKEEASSGNWSSNNDSLVNNNIATCKLSLASALIAKISTLIAIICFFLLLLIELISQLPLVLKK